MLAWIYLAGVIGCESIATSALKAADGFTRPLPTAIVGLVVYKQRLDPPAPVGISRIIAGTLVIKLLSKAGDS